MRFNDVFEQLRKSAQLLKLNNEILSLLAQPQRTVEVSFPVRRDSGA